MTTMIERGRPGRKPKFTSDEERRAYYREYKRKWDAEHPGRQAGYSKAYYKRNAKERAAYERERRKQNPDYWVNPAINRLKRHGYTVLLNGKEV